MPQPLAKQEAALSSTEAQIELAKDIGSFTFDPVAYAWYAFPWGSGDLQGEGRDSPRKWQLEILDTIGKHLRDPETRHKPCLIAVASGHGIGKSAAISMIAKWASDTSVDTKVAITANTEPQLRTKTMPEVAKWFQLSLTRDWFSVNAMSAHVNQKEHEKSWRLDALTWSETNTVAFQGLHNAGKRLLIIFDEASGIPEKIWEVTRGALTDQDTEIIWIAFGNPTEASGGFRDCFRPDSRWHTWHIDSRDVEGTNKELFDEWAEDYGEDSDFFKVRVRGLFPSLSKKQFFAEPDVDAAYGRHLEINQYDFAPKIIGVDPAWEGDDELVISLRQGLMSEILHVMGKNDNDIQVATLLAHFEDEHQADAVFIDAGHGTGIVSAGRTWNRNWQLVYFGGGSSDPACPNKRAEMWNKLRLWLKEGGAIPPDPRLRDELLGAEIDTRDDGKFAPEPKRKMKKRGLWSPGRVDSLALTFAYPVSRKRDRGLQNKVATDYNPFGN